jgi:hypothetical protein
MRASDFAASSPSGLLFTWRIGFFLSRIAISKTKYFSFAAVALLVILVSPQAAMSADASTAQSSTTSFG